MSAPVSQLEATATISPATRRELGLIAVIVVVSAAYWPSFVTMSELWSLSSFRHGYLIPVVCGYLIWQRRQDFAAIPWSPSVIGVMLLAAAVWLWLIARATLVQAVEHVAVLVILNAAVLTFTGVRAYAAIVFPLAYLAFALPIGSQAVPVLMQLTADLSSAALQAFGIPVHRQGMLLTLPGGAFEVADVCSGFNYLYTGLALSVLAAHAMFRSWPRRIAFVAITAVAFLLSNGIRAFVVMAVASATDMRWLTGDDHVIFGWVLFLLVTIGIYFVAERLSDRNTDVDSSR